MADEGIGDANDDDDRQRIADRAAQAFDAKHHEDRGNDQPVERVGVQPFAELREDDGDIGAGAQAEDRRDQVVEGYARPLGTTARRIVHEDQREGDAQHAGEELLGEQHQADIAVQVRRPGERTEGQQRGQRRTDIAQHRIGRRCDIVLVFCRDGRRRLPGRPLVRQGHLPCWIPASL